MDPLSREPLSPEPVIRRADVADAEAGAWCHLLCWREAYAGILEPAKLAERTSDLERRTERWSTSLTDGAVIWIALNPDDMAPIEDRVIGLSWAGPSRDDDAPTPLELYAIYARQSWRGTGLGHRLLDLAIGNQPATVWVLEANHRARTFYQRHGFTTDGAHLDEPYFAVPEIRMTRPTQ